MIPPLVLLGKGMNDINAELSSSTSVEMKHSRCSRIVLSLLKGSGISHSSSDPGPIR